MEISKIEVNTYKIPLPEPVEAFAAGVMKAFDLVICKIVNDDGEHKLPKQLTRFDCTVNIYIYITNAVQMKSCQGYNCSPLYSYTQAKKYLGKSLCM